MSDPLELEERLFAEALVRPEAERAAFLRTVAVEQPAAAGRVAALLAAHARPALLHLSAAPAWLGAPLGRVGRYTLGEKLGEGGVGIVFRAEQREPFRREVALKVIKPGMDTAEVVARFESERQALALMDHPHIARVFDAGATPAGRPYFVMELVSGPSIVKFCDERRLPLAVRLGLFVKVCHAIHHAHGKGVIHRDIKASNVLVANHDGEFTPKVIDFGIAKAMELKLTDKTLQTLFPRFMGTPSSMSPEQAAEDGSEVDARSDVYSLGVLLCELVVGRTPLGSLGPGVGFEEIRRRIRDETPPGPADLLEQLEDEALAATARARHLEPAEFRRVASGELNWIARCSLARARGDRYPTARALADDVQRFLRREPVEAKPPTARASPATPPASGRVETSSRTINVEAHRLVLEGRQHWNKFSEEGFTRAEAAFSEALKVSPGYAMAWAGLAYVSGRRAILATVASRHIEPLLLTAERYAREALARDPNVTEPHAVLGAMEMLRGRFPEASRHLEQALVVNPNSEIAWAYLSRLHMCQGRPDLAIPELENARMLTPTPAMIAVHRGLAFLLARRPLEAFTLLDEAERMGVATPHTRAQAAIALVRLGRKDEALVRARRALDPAAKAGWSAGMNAYSDGLAAWGLAEAGAPAEAQERLDAILRLPEQHHFAAACGVAALGDPTRALELFAGIPPWLVDLVMLFARDTGCFRGHAGFERLLHRLDAAEAWEALRRAVDAPAPKI